jgi:hypothetical protein
VTARDNIDKHLANSRSKDFVARMHAELPSNKRLDRVKAAETEEATIKLCKYKPSRTIH